MGNSNNITKGIKSCYYAYEGKLTYLIKNGDQVYIQAKKRHKFYLDENVSELFGENTEDRKATAQDAKWAFIFDMLFQKAVETPDNEVYQLWADLSKPSSIEKRGIAKMGIGTQYELGTSLELIPENEDDIWLGRRYRVEVFNKIPNNGFYFYFIPVSFPFIRFAYFDKQVITESTTTLGVNEGYYSFGQTHILHLSTHLLPITVLPQDFKPQELGLTIEMDPEHLELEIYLTDEQFNNLLDKPIVKEKLIKFYKGTLGGNVQFDVPILVDPKWRGTIHLAHEKIKSYHFTIQIKNTKTEVTYPKTERFKVTLDGLKKINEDYTDYEFFYVSPNLVVKYETQEEILRNYETAKNNQIQHIGDINYTKREFDPCGFSKITIEEKEDKERDPLIIFDETQPVNQIDKTERGFPVIAGDERKNITIALGGLQTTNQYCQGLLLDDGQKHSVPKNIFQVDKIYAALDNGKIRQVDDTHQQQQRAAGIAPSNENTNDTDVIKTNDFYNPTAVQQWKEGVDYNIESNKEITLKLRYLYNKQNESSNNAWLFNYFILSDDLKQTSFLPISTCRYPNQIAKVLVYPDIEWELAALIALPSWSKKTLKYEETRSDFKRFYSNVGFKYVKRELSVEEGTEDTVTADFTLKAATSGIDYEVGFKIEKSIKKVIAIYNEVYEKATLFDGTHLNVKKSAAYKKGLLKKFDFDIDPPNVAVALKWKYELAKLEKNRGEIGWRMEGEIALKPLLAFGITVDLVPLLKTFGPVGNAVYWIIAAAEKLIDDMDVYFNFKLNGELAAGVSIGYHSLDGWDGKGQVEATVTVNATIEAGIKLEDVTVIANIIRVGRHEKITGIDMGGSLGAGIQYKEVWDSDRKGVFKNVTVEFLGCKGDFYVYVAVTKRKKRVVQGAKSEETYNKQISDKYEKELLPPETWYGPKKFYINDEN